MTEAQFEAALWARAQGLHDIDAASGALAATVFHDRLIAIPELKEFLATCGIEVRP